MNQTEYELKLKELLESIFKKLDRIEEALELPKWEQ